MMVDHQRRLIVKSSGVCLLWLVIIVCGNKGSEIRAGHHHLPSTTTITTTSTTGSRPHIQSHGNVTVLAGQRGELKCQVTNLANYSVMWLRHKDTHLLSIGTDAYIVDTRFRAFQGAGNTWGLRISGTRPSDGGVYECQISTTPPISAFTYLTVVEPVTRIEGLSGRNSELFIKAGSTINLTCIVEDATDNAPKHILWRHNSRTVNFEWSRGGMSLVTEKKMKGVTVSRLLIQKAVRSDSGTYACQPQNAHPSHVKVIVLEQGEKQAAMQSGGVSSTLGLTTTTTAMTTTTTAAGARTRKSLISSSLLPLAQNHFTNLIIGSFVVLLLNHYYHHHLLLILCSPGSQTKTTDIITTHPPPSSSASQEQQQHSIPDKMSIASPPPSASYRPSQKQL